MKSIFTILIVTVSIFAIDINNNFGVKGSGEIITKTINPKQSFQKVSSDLSANITIRHSNQNLISIKTDKNILDKITLYIKHNTLFISANDSIIPTKLNIAIGMVNLNEIRAYGALDIKTENFNIDNLLLDINGASTIRLINTKIKKLNIKADGTFNIICNKNCSIQKSYIKTDGVGDILLNVNTLLKLDVSGTINLKYRGKPQIQKRVEGILNLTPLK
jgi:hypothetical protein